MSGPAPRVVALSGGIGGAKLALGLQHETGGRGLAVIANPGDDFEHLGLAIRPDFDTLLYTLGGLADTTRGWGRRDETWTFMRALEGIGGETWFSLGDGDLALHVERTRRLAAGERPTDFARSLTGRLAIPTDILPATDDPVRTRVLTPDGPLDFQHYFVREQCTPVVTGFELAGADLARVTPEVAAALAAPDLAAVVICPSNPFISIDPILAIPGMREHLGRVRAPVVAVSPIIGGQAVKGPTAKMMAELGLKAGAGAVAAHYRDLIDGFVLDTADADLAATLEVDCLVTGTVMTTDASKRTLAREVLAYARRLRAS